MLRSPPRPHPRRPLNLEALREIPRPSEGIGVPDLRSPSAFAGSETVLMSVQSRAASEVTPIMPMNQGRVRAHVGLPEPPLLASRRWRESHAARRLHSVTQKRRLPRLERFHIRRRGSIFGAIGSCRSERPASHSQRPSARGRKGVNTGTGQGNPLRLQG